MHDYYRILQVARNADPEVIEKAYKVLARKRHPDMHAGGRDAHDAMLELNEAYAVLSDPVKRAAYDASLPSHDSVLEVLEVFWDSGLVGLYRRYVR